MNPRARVLAGGWAHPPDDVIAAAYRLLEPLGFDIDVVTDGSKASAALADPCDFLLVGSCWFSMLDDRYTTEQRAQCAVATDQALIDALDELRRSGCPVLALHTAVISFDGCSPWREWLGGTWDWSTSWHPVPAELDVRAVNGSPFVVEDFTVIDEEYQQLAIDSTVQLVAESGDGHPLVWTHQTDLGRAAVNLLGHDAGSLADPRHESMNRSLIDWLLAT